MPEARRDETLLELSSLLDLAERIAAGGRRADDEAAEELKKHRDRLEELARERTTEIEEKNTRLTAEIERRRQAETALGDVAEKHRAESELARAKAHVDGVMGCMADALVVVGPGGTIRTANHALVRLTGYTEQELVGMPIGTLHGDDPDRMSPWLQLLLGKKAPRDVNAEICSKSGERIPVSLTASLLLSAGAMKRSIRLGDDAPLEPADVEGVIGVMRDLRESQMLARLEAMNDELRRNGESLERANAELRETTAQLVQAEKLSALGELAAGIAHEMNQPLNGIKIITQSLLRDMRRGQLDAAGLSGELGEIVAQVDRMSEIIDHMRIFTRRTEAGALQPLDLNDVVRASLKLYRQQLKNHGIELVEIYDRSLAPVRGDPIRLEQAVVNLATNAVHALETVEGRRRILSLRTLGRPDQNAVAIEVEDNGPGIPDKIRSKMYQPFFTTREPGTGTGLGLSVARKIVEQHGGRIEDTSQLGKGSLFRIVLPAIRADREGPDDQRAV